MIRPEGIWQHLEIYDIQTFVYHQVNCRGQVAAGKRVVGWLVQAKHFVANKLDVCEQASSVQVECHLQAGCFAFQSPVASVGVSNSGTSLMIKIIVVGR